MMEVSDWVVVGVIVAFILLLQAIHISEKRKERKWQPEMVVLPPAKLPKLLGDIEDKMGAFTTVTLEIESWYEGNLRMELDANQVRLLHSGLPAKTLQEIYG